jgi:hypothetical protein
MVVPPQPGPWVSVAFGTTVLGSIGAAAVSRPLESALEAGSTYQEALDRGMSQEDADNAANSVFRKNLSLAGMDAVEFATAFLPTNKVPFLKSSGLLRKGVTTVTKLGATGAMEATEEIMQEKFQREAVGDKFSLSDPATKEAGVIGGMFGVTMGGAGDVFTNIQQGVVDNLGKKERKDFEKEKAVQLKAGLPEEVAQLKALDKIAVTHKNNVKQAVKVQVSNIKKTAQKEQDARREVPEGTMESDQLISHEGAPDEKAVLDYKKRIEAGEDVGPLKVVKEGDRFGIEDGKHRFEAYQRLGTRDIPVEDVTQEVEARRKTVKGIQEKRLKLVEETQAKAKEAGLPNKTPGGIPIEYQPQNIDEASQAWQKNSEKITKLEKQVEELDKQIKTAKDDGKKKLVAKKEKAQAEIIKLNEAFAAKYTPEPSTNVSEKTKPQEARGEAKKGKATQTSQKELKLGTTGGKKREGQEITRSKLETLYRNSPELQKNPVLTVEEGKDGKKTLAFKGKKQQFSINASALGLKEDKLKAGDKIKVSKKLLSGPGVDVRVKEVAGEDKKKFKKSATYADTGGYADYPMHNSDIDAGGSVENELNKQMRVSDITQKTKGIEMPELTKLYRELTGSMKLTLANFKNKLGVFYAIPGGYNIGLNRSLFIKKKNETDKELHDRGAKTMAHELGHLVDFLPDEVMKRGNILGRLFVLKGMRQNFMGDPALLVERKKVMGQIGYRRRKIDKKNISGPAMIKAKDEIINLQDRLDEIHEQLEMNESYTKELKNLTNNWKPFDKKKVPEWYTKYRYSAPELYADFVGVLFTRPDLAKQWAPEFTQKWFETIDKKPDFKKAFFELQMMLNGEREHLVKQRYDDLLAMFKKSDEMFKQSLIERVSHKNNPWYEFKKQMVYQHQWAMDRYKTNKAHFDRYPDADPRFFMEQMDFLGEKVYSKINRNISPIITNLEDAGLSWDELSLVLFSERIAKSKSRNDVANPYGHTVMSTNEILAYIKRYTVTDKQADVLFKAAKDLRKALKYTMLDYDFLYSKEMLEKIKTDDYYAPFNIVEKVFNKLPPGLKHQTGNLNETNNIANNIVLKYIGIIHSGEKSKISSQAIDMVRDMDGGVKEADYKVTDRRTIRVDGQKKYVVQRKPIEPDDQNLGLITEMVDGKLKGYYVPKEIADSFKYEPISHVNMIVKYVFEIPNKYFFKPIFTTINPGFQIVNFFFRDLMTTKKVPGMTWAKLFRYYKEALPKAQKKAWGRYDEQVNEMLEKGILIMNNSGKYQFAESVESRDQEGIDYILQMAGFDKFHGKTKFDKMQGIKQAKSVIDFLQKVGEMFEATPKIAGYNYLLDNEIFAHEKINDHWVRANIGSPNFKKVSKKHFTNNNIALFYNAIIRGWERTYETATYKTSKSAFWFHIVKYAMIPAILGAAADEGLFGDDLKELRRKMSEYMKNNYLSIPIKAARNKVVFFSIPLAEEDRFFHALTRMSIKGAMGDFKEMKKAALDITSYTGGQVPGFAPQVEIGLGWYTYLTGGNPYDMFRGQNVFTMEEEKAGAKIKLPIMAAWTLNKTGLFKFELHDRASNTSLGEATIKNTPILHRFLRISNYGEYEANQIPKREAQIEESTENVIRNRKITRGVTNYWKEKPSDMNKYVQELALDVYGSKVSKEDYNKLIKKFNKQLVGTLDNANLNSLSSGTTKQKVALLLDLQENLSGDDFNKLLQMAQKTRTLSEEVLRAFDQKLKELNASKAFK